MREAGDFNCDFGSLSRTQINTDWFTDLICKQSALICGLISLGTQADEFEESGGGAEDDAADQEPGLGSEPLVQEPAQGAKNSD